MLDIWYTKSPIITGQSIITEHVIELFKDRIKNKFILIPEFNIKSTCTWIVKSLRLLVYSLILKDPVPLYIVPSRSKYGFIRDLPAYSSILLGKRIIAHVHGSDILNLLNDPVLGIFARWFYRRIYVIVPSEHLLPSMLQLGILNIEICENFVSDHWLHTINSRNNIIAHKPNEKIVILWNSNIIYSKGFFVLAECIKNLVDRGHYLEFHVFGEIIGDEYISKADCNKKLQHLTQMDWMKLHGAMDSSHIAMVAKSSHILCLPSFYTSECQPLALIEGMCVGLEIVINDTEALKATVGKYPNYIFKKPKLELIELELIKCINNINTNQTVTTEQVIIAQQRFSKVRFEIEIEALLFSKELTYFSHRL